VRELCRRGRSSAGRGGLLREGDRLVSLAFLGLAARRGDRGPHAARVGGDRGVGGGRGFRHAARVLHHRHAAERLALRRAAQRSRRGLVRVDREVELALGLAQLAELERGRAVRRRDRIERRDRAVDVARGDLRFGVLHGVDDDGLRFLALLVVLLLVVGSGGHRGQQQEEQPGAAFHREASGRLRFSSERRDSPRC
jgi:hypothetical protein